jgi:CDP-diacylglycerol--glycerol-3-phosphate 3-phosphatidyltransferase
MRDIYFSIFMFILVVVIVAAYVIRAQLLGRARHARTDADGGSVFLNKASMEMGYWLIEPIVRALVALRITPNMVTLFSLVPALLAGVAAGFGWFGLACVLATAGSLCDLLDGVLARRLGTASDAGEVVDAAVDRYIEFLFLGGVAVYYRTHWMVIVLTLAAIFGSLMVSYTTAKGEAMQVTLPRGSMRRAERAVYLLVASGLTPITRILFAGSPSHALRELPILVALSLVAVVTNVNVVQRFVAMADALRARHPGPPATHDDDALAPKSDGTSPTARPA